LTELPRKVIEQIKAKEALKKVKVCSNIFDLIQLHLKVALAD
jgi:hypothetical protein